MSTTVKIQGKLLDPYFIEVDTFNYIVHEIRKSKNKEGNPTTKNVVLGYYSEFGGALAEVARRHLLKNKAGKTVEIREFVKEFREIQNNITNMLK
jgi:hypothetical protein